MHFNTFRNYYLDRLLCEWDPNSQSSKESFNRFRMAAPKFAYLCSFILVKSMSMMCAFQKGFGTYGRPCTYNEPWIFNPFFKERRSSEHQVRISLLFIQPTAK
ncbi:hypothetical protein QQP08_011994 [Theobroma cacao]|nr:hypothetical protein QQP08_011994 [Theobroma cacao]